jgi:CheY-like chemotaxis protein
MTEVPSPLRRRILLAEDNPVNRQIVIELLEKRGHEVKLAGNGMACWMLWSVVHSTAF